MKTLESKAAELFALAGIRVNGDRPWDIQVHDEGFYARVVGGGSLAFGESFMDGWWSCPQLDEMIAKLLRAEVDGRIEPWTVLFPVAQAILVNKQRKSRAAEIAERHYDIGNDLYERMLDDRMVYSCGYWKNARDLNDAQTAKLDLVCRKIGLRDSDHVLDIGCGWGSFAKYAAEAYGARVTGITVSREQAKLGRERCAGLPVEIRVQDYRDLDGSFDHIISIGMFEHVGFKNYRAYMEVVARCLKDDGLFLLHTIGGNRSVARIDPWIDKYIFPNSVLPSAKQIAAAAEGLFVVEDWHNFGVDYDATLMAWHANFTRTWDEISASYSPRFYRMWEFYLLSCAGSFRCRRNGLWQVVFSKHGVPGGYVAPR